jgi:2-keto-3-deoxy-L-rhamnonate aldolase RhmA
VLAAAFANRPMSEHLAASAADTVIVAQIEDIAAVEAIEDIAAIQVSTPCSPGAST